MIDKRGIESVVKEIRSRAKKSNGSGVVKTYDPNTGNGIIILDTDKTEVYLTPGSLKGSIFRTLRQGQRINFDIKEDSLKTVNNVRMGKINIKNK